MKIAVTYENGEVFQHFGHTAQFKLYEISEEEVKSTELLSAQGSGHGALAGLLKEHAVDALICGGIGGGAQNALKDLGIDLYPGVSGDADESVRRFLTGQLNYNPDAACEHHHEEGHTCGEHKHNCSGNS